VKTAFPMRLVSLLQLSAECELCYQLYQPIHRLHAEQKVQTCSVRPRAHVCSKAQVPLGTVIRYQIRSQCLRGYICCAS
jgi:hypothetical protein